MKKTIVLFTAFLHLLFCAVSYGNDKKAIDYDTLFTVDIAQNPDILWKIYEDKEQDSEKLLEDRNVRAIFVGRYDDFAEQFEKSIYPKLSVYMSPFQVKILFIDYYLNKFIESGHISKGDKTYLTINNFKKEYSNLFPHIYRRGTAKKKSIIPNKLFKINFFKSEEFIQSYQELFDGITESIEIIRVEKELLMPKLLDESSDIKLSDRDRFIFFKVYAVINETLIKDSFEYFFKQMKELVDIMMLTEFYKLNYFPKIDHKNFTPLEERIITVNVFYNPDSDFEFDEMEYAKKCALIHEYFVHEQLVEMTGSPILREAASDFVEVQIAFSYTLFPPKELFDFEYKDDEGYFEDAVKDFYDSLDDAMEITEEVVSSGEFSIDIIKLTATVDEVTLMGLMEMLRVDIAEFKK